MATTVCQNRLLSLFQSRGLLYCFRQFSVAARCKSKDAMNVFDRKAKSHQRNVAARAANHEVYDYLKEEVLSGGFLSIEEAKVASRLVDRVSDVSRHFPLALDLGCGKGFVSRHLDQDTVGMLYQCDLSPGMLAHCRNVDVPTANLVVDEEVLCFRRNIFDLVVSSLSLHWVNDLPGALKQIISSLKEDGVFLGAMFGGDTLFELRSALQVAELEREGGFAPHISPFAQMRDIGDLLSRAGFSLTTIDMDEITIHYPSMFEVMQDLKGMGENNASWNRKSVLHRGTQKAAATIYKDYYGDDDGTVPATFQILYMIGWKPSKSQPKPAERGSATASLKDIADIMKISTSEKPSR